MSLFKDFKQVVHRSTGTLFTASCCLKLNCIVILKSNRAYRNILSGCIQLMCLMLGILSNDIYHPFQFSGVYCFSMTLHSLHLTCYLIRAVPLKICENRKPFILNLLRLMLRTNTLVLVAVNLEWRSFSLKTWGFCLHIGKPSSQDNISPVRYSVW